MPGKLDALPRKGVTTNTLGFPLPNHQHGLRHTTGTPSFARRTTVWGGRIMFRLSRGRRVFTDVVPSA